MSLGYFWNGVYAGLDLVEDTGPGKLCVSFFSPWAFVFTKFLFCEHT
jgi:hypothetical protein